MSVHPKLANRSCYHKYEIEPGFFTPGKFIAVEPKLCLDEIGVPKSLLGLRALDIGAWDGPFTFELERRGAQVTALDIQDPDITVFNAVKEIKNSSARFVLGTIYDALPENLGIYDIVLFAGVYYHLKSPVLALQRIRRLLGDGGTLFIEGASATDHLAEQINTALKLPKSRLRATAESLDRMPLIYFDAEHRIYPHWSNWSFPTTRGLEAILLDSGFRNVAVKRMKNAFVAYTHPRLMGRAEADPAKPDPGDQGYEHDVATQDPFTDQHVVSASSRLLSSLPLGVQRALKRGRRAVRRLCGILKSEPTNKI